MRMYNGITLPALPGYNESVYTHGFIQYGGVAGMEIYNLIVSTASGVMGDSYTVGEHTYSAWVVAANETAAENLSGAYPGISTKEWLQFEDGKTVTASTYDNIVWSDFDILKTDGSVYLKASKPFDLDAFKIGLSLGLCGKALPWKSEPVAWLYNGWRLPKLPEWDRETYPYAIINFGTISYLYVSDVPFFYIPKEPDTLYEVYNAYTKEAGSALCYVGAETAKDFLRKEDYDITLRAGGRAHIQIEWANHDIYSVADDSLYLAATDPIPVYE